MNHPEQYRNIYEIPIEDCSDRDELLFWLRHLTDKQWVTITVIHDFARAAIRYFEVR